MVIVSGGWVEFRFFRPQAKQVHLAGDFNGWRCGELPMARSQDGYWLARLRLPPGEFRFRYSADGRWFTDYAAFGVEVTPLGVNSIVRVDRRQREQEPQEVAEQAVQAVQAGSASPAKRSARASSGRGGRAA